MDTKFEAEKLAAVIHATLKLDDLPFEAAWNNNEGIIEEHIRVAFRKHEEETIHRVMHLARAARIVDIGSDKYR